MRRGPLAGALTAIVTGGVMALLVTLAGEGASGVIGVIPGIAALTVPLVAAGTVFGWLVDTNRLPSLGPGILYWAAAFPAARLLQELLLVGSGHFGGLEGGLGGFLLYQAIVGLGFGLGFLLLHNWTYQRLHRRLDPADTPASDGNPDRDAT